MSGASSGTIGGRYALAAEIAAGGMATVHLARQVGAAGFARTVAVKRLHERFSRDPDFVAMFLDEARLVARIRHPNVVQTIDVVAEGSPGPGLSSGELFIVMEYVHGESLLRLLQTATKREKLVPVKIAAAIIVGALHGLHEAHEARSETGEPLGIVHRDVSPHNILVGVEGVARVLDFGVAKATERLTTTHEGDLKGKLSYMAPEQVTNRSIDRRTDVYAAAVVFWETLTASKLVAGANEGAVVQQILTGPVRPPSALNIAVPEALDAVVMRGLSRDPEQRFASAREMALAIEQAITLATPSEVGAWVMAMCPESIEARAQLISKIEARSSTTNLKQAVDSLRQLSPGAMRTPPAGMPIPEGFQSPGPMQTFPPAPVQTFPPNAAFKQQETNAALQMNVPPAAGAARWLVAVVAISAVLVLAAIASVVLLLVRPAPSAPAIAASNSTKISADGGESKQAASAAAVAVAPSCPEGMVLVAGGRYFMGSDDDLADEKPAHNVTLRAFCMDKLEVSTDAYRACSDRGECKRAGTTNKFEGMTPKDQKTYDPLCNFGAPDRGKHPINCVDWSMADRFCKAEGKRLPTEAEWEFAARGSDGRKYPWGDAKPTSKHLNACGKECATWLRKHGAQEDGFLYADDDGWPTTAPVGSFPLGASRSGVEDIVGNVWEWVADWHSAYTADDQTDPTGPTEGKERVVRGGAWNGAYPDWVRPSYRFKSSPDTRSHGIGFRCAKSI